MLVGCEDDGSAEKARVWAVIRRFSDRQIHMGRLGAGTAAKLALNMIPMSAVLNLPASLPPSLYTASRASEQKIIASNRPILPHVDLAGSQLYMMSRRSSSRRVVLSCMIHV